ncbi:TPM domain-containing protein [Bacteroidales bacterium OttesenSCG-928-I21]|nr:TPM domain-containing protein [Bacteroidales bacterium OttesenSCG-928-I21]
MKKYILLLFLIFPQVFFAQEYTVKTVPNPHTADIANYVSNPDRILNSQTVRQINNELQSLENDTKAEVAIVMLNSIGYEEIEDFGVELFEEWGIGKKNIDNGLLILFVLDQRAIRFEVGYGLEGVITDALSKRIQTRQMLPYFRDGDYDAGILAGVQSVASLIRKEPVPEIEGSSITWTKTLRFILIAYLLLIFISFIWDVNIVHSVKKDENLGTNIKKYIAIKSRKKTIFFTMGIFIPLAGLMFFLFFGAFKAVLYLLPIPLMTLPGELYARLQMRIVRRKPIPCKSGNGMMHIVSEKDDDKYLTDSQRFEEKIKSVDYDVFVCDTCKKSAVYSVNLKSSYKECPRCGTRAFKKVNSQVVSAATYSSAGIQRVNYRCEFCGYEESKNEKIPKLERSSSGAFAAGGSSFGGIGGGGSSSSGGSFGGGRSGGGGSTSRW